MSYHNANAIPNVMADSFVYRVTPVNKIEKTNADMLPYFSYFTVNNKLNKKNKTNQTEKDNPTS